STIIRCDDVILDTRVFSMSEEVGMARAVLA
ncbi:MAG: hypothetical protein H6Q54_2073, partial [Deltaproteobacteria bacterium]|nr:hypothetical protein [Deltaproteobacteria bacterium]